MGEKTKQKDPKVALEKFQQTLSDLSDKELQLLIRSAEFILTQRSSEDLHDAEHEANEMLFGIINDVILAGNRSRSLVPHSQSKYPHFVRRHPSAARALTANRKLLESFVQENYGRTDLNEYSQLYTLFFRVLVRALRKEGTTVGVVSVIDHIHRIPQVLDDAFPGYVPAGLLRLLVRNNSTTLH